MRRPISKSGAAFITALGALGVLACLTGAVTALFPGLLEAWADALRRGVWARLAAAAVFAAAGALCAMGVRRLLTPYTTPDNLPQDGLSIDTDGRVMVSKTALSALVTAAVGEIPGVDHYTVSVSGTARALEVTLNMVVKAGAAVPQLSDTAQKAVAEVLRDIAGIDSAGVTLAVTGVAAAEA